MRMTDAMIQIMKVVVGRDPVFNLILIKAIIPVTTTITVSVRGILKDSLISRILSRLFILACSSGCPQANYYTLNST